MKGARTRKGWICTGACDAKETEDGSAVERTAARVQAHAEAGPAKERVVSGEFLFQTFEEPAIIAVQLHI